MTARAIVHLDADAFFASVEQAADPRLRGKPVAVGGEQRGIIASASYEARQFGVYTPMPTSRARKLCPKLILLPGDFEKYERFSNWMFSYAYDFTPAVEVGAIDEGFLDLSAQRKSPVEIADRLRQAIRQALKITVSEGIGSSKLVSQIASKLNKPAAFFHVPFGRETAFLHPLRNYWLPGIGGKTGQRLDAAGLASIGQIAATPTDLLSLLLGKMARPLKSFSEGIDDRPVIPLPPPAKSYSEQETFAEDLTDEPAIERTLRGMADRLMAKVRADGKSVRTISIKIRYNDRDESQTSESLPEPADLETDIYPRLRPLLQRAWQRRVSLRMASLKLSNVYHGWFATRLALDGFARQQEARERFAGTLDELRRQHGAGAIVRGRDLSFESRTGDTPATRPPAPRPAAHVRSSPLAANRWANNGGSRKGARPHPNPLLQEKVPNGLPARGGYERAVHPKPLAARLPPPGRSPSPAAAYLPLRVHSYYSFLDSTLSIKAVVALARGLGLKAVALTDAANLHGAVELVQEARSAGLKPIIGAEIRLENLPLALYAQNREGYHNLCRLLTRMHTESGGRAPRSLIEAESPAESPAARSLPSARLNAEISWLSGGTAGLVAVGSKPAWAELFPGAFYLGLAGGPLPEGSSSLKPVAFASIHYAVPEDRWKYDVVQSIRTRTLLRQAHPEKDSGHDLHFPAAGEWANRYPEAWLKSTLEIAERCEFEPLFGPPQFPAFNPPDGSAPGEFLGRLVRAGMARRYRSASREVQAQVQEELAMIAEVGYEEYFLVIWDLLQACRERGIEWITRGSAADSLVCYCLGISDVCPIRFGLYFRRFLNKERMKLNKLPDIDIDFPHDRKDDVLDLVFAKYGKEHTAVVGGFSTYRARSALGDVAKVLGVSEYQIRRVTAHLPMGGAGELGQLAADSLECRELPFAEEPYRSAMKMAAFLDGFPRHPKMHPCGVVLSREAMSRVAPCFVSHKGYLATHFDMDAIETMGLVKMDILAQGGLAVMRDVREMLGQRGIHPDLEALELWDDPAVWELIAGGGARAVHHIESPAMIGLCRMCQARDIDTLIAIVSVIRPGAANESKKMEFARRYQGLTPTVYPHPSLEACLKSTFGLVVYEEHILQICESFAGLPPGRADILRRALGKDQTGVIEEIRHEFAACARSLGRTEKEISEVWKLVSGFRGYAFCKAHSTAYGIEAYQSAWLKRYYPAEVMAAVLTNGKGFYRPLVYVLECHRLGIPLLNPCINEPGPDFQVVRNPPPPPGDAQPMTAAPRTSLTVPKPDPRGPEPDGPMREWQGSFPSAFSLQPSAFTKIRVPIAYLKNLSEELKTRILTERQEGAFESLADFYQRVRPSAEEMEILIRVGAFDLFGKPRTAQFWEFQILARSGAGGEPGQRWLFPPMGAERAPGIALQEPSAQQRLEWENEFIGFPVSDHPLALYRDVAWETYCPVKELGEHVGGIVTLCGLVIEDRLFQQVTGETMKFLTLADWTGIIETELFARTYRSYGLATVRYPVLEITGKLEPFENSKGYSLRVLYAGKPRKNPSPARSDGGGHETVTKRSALTPTLSPRRGRPPARRRHGLPLSRRDK